MLRGSVVPFAVQYERRGRQAGLAQGLEMGLEKGRKEIRSLLPRGQLDPRWPDPRPRNARHPSRVRQARKEHLPETALPRLEDDPQPLIQLPLPQLSRTVTS